MFIKLTTVRTKDKIYKYVKLLRRVSFNEFNPYTSSGTRPPQEKVVATLGTLEDVLASRESIITGLNRLGAESPSSTNGQKPTSGSSFLRSWKRPVIRMKPKAKKSTLKTTSKNKQTKKRRK